MRAALLLSLLCLASCSSPENAFAASADDPLPADAVVLPISATRAILRQCSRQAPAAGESGWRPGGADIAALEAAVATALQARVEADDPDWRGFPQGWRRQYVGIVRDGRRFIYGNFYPREIAGYPVDSDEWQRTPTIVCDGGPIFFGVEYDITTGRLTQLAFNGPI